MKLSEKALEDFKRDKRYEYKQTLFYFLDWLNEDIDGSNEQNEDMTYQRINKYLIEEE